MRLSSNPMRKPNIYLLFGYAVLVIVTTLTYLPALNQATIYRDDWYYTLDRLKGGPDTFPRMFEIDRPLRGYFFEAYYRLFGVNPKPYHLVGFALRLLVSLAAFWFFRLLWPEHIEAALVMSLLFVIYPGYSHWLEGFEDQPHIFSLCLLVFSIILSLKAVEAPQVLRKSLFWAGSILAGWGYILLVDYAIGMELFRLLCIFLIANRGQQDLPLLKKGKAAVRAWLPAVLIPGVFLVWRLLLFENQRTETDIGLQFSVILQSPLRGAYAWLVNLFRSVLNQSVLAWWAPDFQDFFTQSTRSLFFSLLAAGFSALLIASLMLWKIKRAERKEPLKSAFWIGLFGVVAGVLPVISANRLVSFGPYSHYALPASLAAAVLVGGVIYSVDSGYFRAGMTAVLVLLAVMNQAVISAKVLNEERVIANFWHQVAWRVPGIQAGTALVVYYPTVSYGEDVDAVNGPANYIYYPGPDESLPVIYPLYGAKQYPWTAKEIMSEVEQEVGYRTHKGIFDPMNSLVLSQPFKSACVHIINGKYPWFSYSDPDYILAAGSYSKIENILLDVPSPKLDSAIFGPEPAHGWCYYYQKAELAAQNQDWKTVLDLAQEIEGQKFTINERLEWMPFLQAYAATGDVAGFKDATEKIITVGTFDEFSSADVRMIGEYNRRQACSVMLGMQEAGQEFTVQIADLIGTTLCSQ